MILLKELNPHNLPTTPEIDDNLLELLRIMNIIRLHYGQPLKVNSGLRSNEQQEHLVSTGKSDAPKSKHLTGQAVDIHDDGYIKIWTVNNTPLLEQLGVYCEDFLSTPTWVHFQIVAPKSGNRFFKP